MARSRIGPSKAQRGIALVLALWVTVLLTVITSGFVFSMHSEAMATRNALSIARARAAADGAIERTAFELQRPRMPQSWTVDGATHIWRDEDIDIRVNAVDEAARIDINVAPQVLLKSLLVSQGLDDDRAAALSEAIADWRDPDDFKHPHGAEEADYKAAGLDYGPTNGPFETTAELARVLGMTSDLYNRLMPLVTVYSRQPGVNPQTASRAVLLALPNASADTVDMYLAQRAAALDQKLPLPPFPQAQGFMSGSIPVWRIHAVATTPDGVTFAREAVLRPSSDPQRPLIALAWLEPPRASVAAPAATSSTSASAADSPSTPRAEPGAGGLAFSSSTDHAR
jgi:general secretion pathway protein K